MINIFSKCLGYSFKRSKGITIANALQKVLNNPKRKPGVDKYSEFFNRPMKSWLQDNNIQMYSTFSKAKSAVTEKVLEL